MKLNLLKIHSTTSKIVDDYISESIDRELDEHCCMLLLLCL